MKTRVIILLSAIAIVAVSIAGIGSYIKFAILQPLELDDDYNVMELPFQVLTDDGLKFAIEFAISLRNEQPDDPTTDFDPPTSDTTIGTEPNTQPPTGTTPVLPPTTGSTAPTDPTTPPTTQPTEPKPTPPPTKPPETGDKYPGHDFSQGAVSDDWFENVLFIGESRTVGLRDYARSGNAEYFCGVGASTFNILKKSFADGSRFPEQKLEALLSSKQYDKIFINLGINECGYPAKTIIAAYKTILELVQEKQPNATIILQGVLTVTTKYAGSKAHFKPSSIQALNKKIEALADNSKIFYIDANPYFTDTNGYLYKDITGDGCHFTGKYYKVWAQWISFAVGQLGI